MTVTNDGWNHVREGILFNEKSRNKFSFFIDPDSQTKRIHGKRGDDAGSLCSRTPYTQNSTDINLDVVDYQKNMCRNCARIILAEQNGNSEKVVRTSTGKKKKSKHKRLDPHRKTLNKTKQDFLDALTKTDDARIKLPDIIGDDQESFDEMFTISLNILTKLRKAARLNLERVVKEWMSDFNPGRNSFELIQRAQELKNLIQYIDLIRSLKN